MNPDLQNQLAGFIGDARKAGADAASFIKQQAPDLFEQIVRDKLCTAIWDVLTEAVLIVLTLKTIRWMCLKWRVAEDGDQDDRGMACILASVIGAIFVIIMIFALNADLGEAIHCLTAPKLVVMQTITSLAK